MRGDCVLLLSAAVLLLGLGCGAAKRFDCDRFCKQTRFSGMIGGCRCGFTLFTSKRSDSSGQRARTPRLPLPLALSEEGSRLLELPRQTAVPEQDVNVLMPYLFFRDMRRARGQKEVMEDTDFRGKDDLVFGNMYQ